MGPLISAEHLARVASYVPPDAPVAFRGDAPAGPGYWFAPTVLAPVRPDYPAYTEEVFGPVVAVVPFEDEADAVKIANDTPYGLSGSIWTQNLGRALRVARAVRDRQPVGQLALLGALLDAVRRLQALGAWAASWARRPGVLHRGQERVHRHGQERDVSRLQDRVVVVTGGGSGIGLASTRRLAAEGARVVVGDIDEAAGAAAAKEVDGLFVPVDVAVEDQVDALFDAAVETYGRLDVAFNNAGISPPEDDSLLDTDLDVWRRVQEVNLTSVFLCCKHAIPHMQRGGRARSSTPRRSWP
jgi:hypothetical protein